MAEYQKQWSDLVAEFKILILTKNNVIVWGHLLPVF